MSSPGETRKKFGGALIWRDMAAKHAMSKEGEFRGTIGALSGITFNRIVFLHRKTWNKHPLQQASTMFLFLLLLYGNNIEVNNGRARL